MADSNQDDDIYDDPDTIGDVDDDVNGAAEVPDDEKEDLSQSIYNPERYTTDLDDRGPIDELEVSDATSSRELDDTVDPALLDEDPDNFDGDSYQVNGENPDEQDGTEK